VLKEVFYWSTFDHVMGEKLIASSALCTEALSCWKMKNSL